MYSNWSHFFTSDVFHEPWTELFDLYLDGFYFILFFCIVACECVDDKMQALTFDVVLNMRSVYRWNQYGSDISDCVGSQGSKPVGDPILARCYSCKGEKSYIWTLYIMHTVMAAPVCLSILGLSPVAVHHHVTNGEAGSAVHPSSLKAFVIEMARHMQGTLSHSYHQPEISLAALTWGSTISLNLSNVTFFSFFHIPIHADSDGTMCPVLPFQKHKSCDATGEGFCSVWWMGRWSLRLL